MRGKGGERSERAGSGSVGVGGTMSRGDSSSTPREKSTRSNTSSGRWKDSAAVRVLERWGDAPEVSAGGSWHTSRACLRALKSEDLLKVRRRLREEVNDFAFGECVAVAGTRARLSGPLAVSSTLRTSGQSFSSQVSVLRTGSDRVKSGGAEWGEGVRGGVDALLDESDGVDGLERSRATCVSRAGLARIPWAPLARVCTDAPRGRLREARGSFFRREMDERERDRSERLYAR
ncbi:hypothetical protein BV20DRAFT_258503 [Pilatotrama ljubarskyi]|nr:hypothetical protein BV20DRAFT_258503 [Pilatotrama ljubarskyi]